MRRALCGFVPILVLALAGPTEARRPTPVPSTVSGRTVVTLDRTALRKQFPGKPAEAVNVELRRGAWKPDASWLRSEGKKYGRLLIVSDLHPSTGEDPVTRKVNPSEDFKSNQQEQDFRRMMESEWTSARQDARVRTLVLNGDTLEFMQTTRAATGFALDGKHDRYGPLNTPQHIAGKLKAIYGGHRLLFGTYAEHLYRGHRLVFVPGNHDRQTLHPTVRRVAIRGLIREVAALIAQDRKFMPEVGIHKRRKLAKIEAKKIVRERLEFHPWFFMVGDVVARHGHETDKYNAFSTPFGDYYHPGAKDGEMEAALGDYIVKGVFNKIERRQPWTDNTSRAWSMAKALVRASDGNPIKAANFLRWLLTREGSPASKRARAKAAARMEQDVRRYVREFGLLTKFNAIRPSDRHLNEEQLVQTLLSYEGKAATPALSNFRKGHGAFRRLGRLATLIPSIFTSKKASHREQMMSEILFRDLFVGTLAVGHDHTFRVEPRLVLDTARGTANRATVLDTATWTDRLPEVKRDSGFTPNDRRGVLVVDFDAKGSHATLMNYDPARGGLQRVNVLETEQEARQP
jgi:hypothetical protein